MKIPRFTRMSAIPAAAILAAVVSMAAAQAADNSPQQQIRTLLSTSYDRPDHKVETSPIAVSNGYAIADWIQGKNGGRALLRLVNGKWEVLACGGDGLKDIKALTDAGISKQTGEDLVAHLTKYEKSVNADRVKRFGLFGTAKDPRMTNQ